MCMCPCACACGMWFQFAPRAPEVLYREQRTGRAHRNQYASCRGSETGSGAERIFRTHQRGRDILWIPDRGVDEATDGRKRMLERLRLVELLDLLEGRLQEHIRLNRAHGVLPCARAKDPCGWHGCVPLDDRGITELVRMDHWMSFEGE